MKISHSNAEPTASMDSSPMDALSINHIPKHNKNKWILQHLASPSLQEKINGREAKRLQNNPPTLPPLIRPPPSKITLKFWAILTHRSTHQLLRPPLIMI